MALGIGLAVGAIVLILCIRHPKFLIAWILFCLFMIFVTSN